MNPAIVLLFVFVASGTVLIAISLPLILGRVKPNGVYGFRVQRTLDDPTVWYPANAYAGWRLAALGIVEISVAVALFCVPGLNLAVYASIVGGVVLAGVLVALVQCFRHLNQLTRHNDTAK